MRLLSIFALLFLVSFLLHNGSEEQLAPEEQLEQEPDGEPLPVSEEDFSGIIFKQPYPVRHFDFWQESGFSAIEQEIKNLIIGWKNDDSFKTTNHFCAVGYEFPRTSQDRKKGSLKKEMKEVVVYWREGRTLFRWNGGTPEEAKKDFYYARTLMYSRHSIPLDDEPGRDKDAAPINDLTSDKDRVRQLSKYCDQHGRQYTIEPFAPPPRGFTPAPPPAVPRPSRAPRPSTVPPQGDNPSPPVAARPSPEPVPSAAPAP